MSENLTKAPNDRACSLFAVVLGKLKACDLAPTRLMPTVEGGIEIIFVEREKRASIEIYNTGELIAATYGTDIQPKIWEILDIEHSLEMTIHQICVYLTNPLDVYESLY